MLSSAEWFGTEFREFASILVPRNGILRCILFRRKGFGTELWAFDSFFVPRNGIPSCFLFRGRVRNGIPRFSFPRNNRNSVGNNHLFRLFRLPRNYFFCRKFPTLSTTRATKEDTCFPLPTTSLFQGLYLLLGGLLSLWSGAPRALPMDGQCLQQFSIGRTRRPHAGVTRINWHKQFVPLSSSSSLIHPGIHSFRYSFMQAGIHS